MTRRQIIFAFFVAFLLFILWQVAWILSPFIDPLFWSGLVAFALYPIHQKIRKSIGNRENIAAFISTLLIILLIVPLTVLIVYHLVKDSVLLYGWFEDYLREGKHKEVLAQLRTTALGQRIEHFMQWDAVEDVMSEFAVFLKTKLGTSLSVNLAIFTKNLLLLIVNFFLAIFFSFFLLRDGEKIYKFFYDITPLEEPGKHVIFRQINESFSAVIHGQLLTAIVQSVIAGVVFWLLGIPVPFLFALLTFLFALIPIFGAASIWVPLCLYLVAIQAFGKAVILLLLGVFVISLIDNFLKPIFIGQRIKLPYFLLFLGMLGGLTVYGIRGVFLAPVVLSLFFATIKIYQERILNGSYGHPEP